MNRTLVHRAAVWEKGTCILLGQMRGLSGELVTQADIAEINIDIHLDSQQIAAFTCDVTTTVYDTLQLDSRWDAGW